MDFYFARQLSSIVIFVVTWLAVQAQNDLNRTYVLFIVSCCCEAFSCSNNSCNKSFCLRLKFDLVTKPLFLAFFTGFAVLPTNITARNSFPARFDCKATNSDTTFVRWTIGDSNFMLSDSTCSGCMLQLNGSLIISSVSQGHAGRYTCVLFEGSPVARYSVYLTVAGW